MKGGESMRSDVSSRRRRRGVGEGSEGVVVRDGWDCSVGGGDVDMPDSWSTKSSSSRGGSR